MRDRRRFRKPQDAIAALGYPGVTAWARAHGFRPGTVMMTLRRWWLRPGKRPHGGIAREIIAALEADLAALSDRERSGTKEVA